MRLQLAGGYAWGRVRWGESTGRGNTLVSQTLLVARRVKVDRHQGPCQDETACTNARAALQPLPQHIPPPNTCMRRPAALLRRSPTRIPSPSSWPLIAGDTMSHTPAGMMDGGPIPCWRGRGQDMVES